MSGNRLINAYARLLQTPVAISVWVMCVVCVSVLVFDLTEDSSNRLFAADCGLPSSLVVLSEAPWKLVSYTFVHSSLVHLFVNFVVLVVFGVMLVEHGYGLRRFLILFFSGGVSGGLLYVLCYGVLLSGHGLLLGSSASVMAVVVAAALTVPTRHLYVPGAPTVLHGFVAMVMIAAIALMLGDDNLGGAIAHIGGAVAGFFVTLIGDFNKSKGRMPGNYAYRAIAANSDDEMHDLRLKVENSGYTSLSEEERVRMFELSQMNADNEKFC